MKLLLLFGNGAVGKMTVGQELTKITDLRLFHNHMTIEPMVEVFGEFRVDFLMRLRNLFFEEFAASGKYGIIFTFMWEFDDPRGWEFTEHLADMFKAHGAEIYYAELVASREARFERNATENRLLHKPSKRNIEMSNWRLTKMDEDNRYESLDGELTFENYVKIDNTAIGPDVVAQMIKERFAL